MERPWSRRSLTRIRSAGCSPNLNRLMFTSLILNKPYLMWLTSTWKKMQYSKNESNNYDADQTWITTSTRFCSRDSKLNRSGWIQITVCVMWVRNVQGTWAGRRLSHARLGRSGWRKKSSPKMRRIYRRPCCGVDCGVDVPASRCRCAPPSSRVAGLALLVVCYTRHLVYPNLVVQGVDRIGGTG